MIKVINVVIIAKIALRGVNRHFRCLAVLRSGSSWIPHVPSVGSTNELILLCHILAFIPISTPLFSEG
jgi:hypothetical protein